MDAIPLSKLAEFAQGHALVRQERSFNFSHQHGFTHAAVAEICSWPCAGRISTATLSSTKPSSAAPPAQSWTVIGPERLRAILRSSASTTRWSPINKSRRDYRRIAFSQSRRHHRQQRQDDDERFRRGGPRHALPRHENRREFQQSRRPSANDSGGDVEGRDRRLGNWE